MSAAHYSAAELAQARRYGDVTANGIAFDWWLASIDGAGFALLREPHHSDADIERAKRLLRDDRDVVTLCVRRPAE